MYQNMFKPLTQKQKDDAARDLDDQAQHIRVLEEGLLWFSIPHLKVTYCMSPEAVKMQLEDVESDLLMLDSFEQDELFILLKEKWALKAVLNPAL